jgi:hypothetical protein
MNILRERRESWGYMETRTRERLNQPVTLIPTCSITYAVPADGKSDDIRPRSRPFTGSFYLFEKPLAFREETFNTL